MVDRRKQKSPFCATMASQPGAPSASSSIVSLFAIQASALHPLAWISEEALCWAMAPTMLGTTSLARIRAIPHPIVTDVFLRRRINQVNTFMAPSGP